EALKDLLTRCKEALKADDEKLAGELLGQAEKRVSEGVGDHLKGLFDACKFDLEMLRVLNEIDQFRWTLKNNNYPNGKEVADRLRRAFTEQFGLISGQPSVEEARAAGRRVVSSAVCDRLVAALDLWLWNEKVEVTPVKVKTTVTAIEDGKPVTRTIER